MTIEENVYQTIRKRSKFLISRGNEWTKEISSAKNYIATPDLKDWTFGKSAGLDHTYHVNGGAAKKWLYSIGFVDVLKLPNGKFKTTIINCFEIWAFKIKAFDILEKFRKDQRNNKRFEILIHNTLLSKNILAKTNILESNQTLFDEGFKNTIVKEVTVRNKKVIAAAKEKYGTKCKVCEFSFGEVFGAHGMGFIEMHHLNPIKDGERKTAVNDLRPVCPNCHRMLHKGDRLLTLEELKDLVRIQKNKAGI